MLNFLTAEQRKRAYRNLLGNLSSDSFTASFFEINEEYVRVCFSAPYSDMRVISLHSLPELCLFKPDWNTDHKVHRCENWFKNAEEDPHDKDHTEHKKMIIEFCLMMVDDVEKQMKEQIKIYKKQLKQSHEFSIPRPLGKYKAPKFIEFQI